MIGLPKIYTNSIYQLRFKVEFLWVNVVGDILLNGEVAQRNGFAEGMRNIVVTIIELGVS